MAVSLIIKMLTTVASGFASLVGSLVILTALVTFLFLLNFTIDCWRLQACCMALFVCARLVDSPTYSRLRNNPSVVIDNPSGRSIPFGTMLGARFGRRYCTIIFKHLSRHPPIWRRLPAASTTVRQAPLAVAPLLWTHNGGW